MSIGLAGCVNELFEPNGMLDVLILAGSVALCKPIFNGVEMLPDEIDDITFGADVFKHIEAVGTAGFMKRSLVLRPCNQIQSNTVQSVETKSF